MAEEKNTSFKIDISSKAVERSIELASDFLSELIGPSVKELGLLMKDSVTKWRVERQIRILNKTREYCNKHNISPKAISLKLLVPLLESAGLEEDEFLQDKWSILLGNMVDTDQNNQNNVLPFILSQLSKDEFIRLEEEVKRTTYEVDALMPELEVLRQKREKSYISVPEHQMKDIQNKITLASYIEKRLFQPFEIWNLVRCGLIRPIPIQYGFSEGVSVGGYRSEEGLTTSGIDVNIEHIDDYYVFTELGKLFFKVCKEKANTAKKRKAKKKG